MWQPWASLIAVGAKTIETRSWSTKYRGPLAIHAAKRPPGSWLVHERDDEVRPSTRGTRWFEENERFCHFDEGKDAWSAYTWAGPLAAVVATCELVDCVPMVAWADPADEFGYFLRVELNEDLWLYNLGSGRCKDVTAQRPYGDFTPGRFAWLLDNVEVLADPLSAKGHQTLWEWTP